VNTSTDTATATVTNVDHTTALLTAMGLAAVVAVLIIAIAFLTIGVYYKKPSKCTDCSNIAEEPSVVSESNGKNEVKAIAAGDSDASGSDSEGVIEETEEHEEGAQSPVSSTTDMGSNEKLDETLPEQWSSEAEIHGASRCAPSHGGHVSVAGGDGSPDRRDAVGSRVQRRVKVDRRRQARVVVILGHQFFEISESDTDDDAEKI
jgi:hypothetical protein